MTISETGNPSAKMTSFNSASVAIFVLRGYGTFLGLEFQRFLVNLTFGFRFGGGSGAAPGGI